MNTKIKSRILPFFTSIFLILVVYGVLQAIGVFQAIPLLPNSLALAQNNNPPALQPILLTDGQDKYPLGLHLEILEDPGGTLTIDQVNYPQFNSQFIPSQADVPNFGYTDSIYWVRFRLDNEAHQVKEWLLELGFANMQYVDLYSPMADSEGFIVNQTGSARPVSTRDVLNPNIVFTLSTPALSQQIYYMRFQNAASMTLPLTIWTERAFSVHSQWAQMLYWFFFGAIFILLVYHLFLLLTLRETIYLLFIILLASAFVLILSYSGYLEVYLFPSLYKVKALYLPSLFSFLIASMVLFSDAFLKLKSRSTKLHRIHLIILVGWGLLIFLSLFLNYHSIVILMMVWGLASLITSFAAGILTWRQGYNPARFLMIAWFGMLAFFILLFFVRFGIAPSTYVTENLYLVGMIWMAVCWSIALSDRITLLKAETEHAYLELSNSEHRLSRILDSLPLGVLLYGKDQRAKYANQRVYDIFNNPAQNVMVDPEARRTVEEAISYFSLKVASTSQKYPLENFPIFTALKGEMKSADDIEIARGDERIALEVQANPVLDDDGNIESAVVAIQDITKRKRVEAELDEHRKQLENLVAKRTAELSSINEELTAEAAERKNLELALQQRIEWLSLVNVVRQKITGTTSIPSANEDLSKKILELFNARLVFIVRWDNQNGPLETFCYPSEGDLTPDAQVLNSAFRPDSLLRREIESGKTITWFSDQDGLFSEPLVGFFQAHDIHSAIFVPLKVHKSIVGLVSVIGLDLSQGILSYEVDLIERMATDLADIARAADLMDQNKVLITAEERNRLARELHDSVTQTLFAASILAEATPLIWNKDQTIARQNMDKLSVLIRGALAEMRSMLFELRAEDLQHQSLGQLLTMLVEAAQARTSTVINITRMDSVELPDDVSIAFYRIAREAINNIIVHAEATHLYIDLIVEQGQVELHLNDDGCGFDPQAVSDGHLGIRIMHERAAMIGGHLQIESKPGQGTEVTVSWSDRAGGSS